MPATNRPRPLPTLLAPLVVLIGATLATGCATTSPRAVYVPERGDIALGAPHADVEVLLDHEPEQPYVVVGRFFAHSASSERSIARIKAQAAKVGVDGVYSIDCDTRFTGECSAMGFMYRVDDADPHPNVALLTAP